MTWLVERLAELRRYIDHLRAIRPRVAGPTAMEHDLSLKNDVVHSLLLVYQLVIDISGELAARRGERFEDYTTAIRALAHDSRFPSALVTELARLPGFGNVVVHEYIELDMGRVMDALDALDPMEQFIGIVADIEASTS
jgi:uncharacterized protein YutE (UPF0331/DUF86 family)